MELKSIFLLITFLAHIIENVITQTEQNTQEQKKMTYSEIINKDYHAKRIKNFYKKATKILSKERLYASVSYHGVGLFANKDFKPNEVAMEIPANYTISSYDMVFPYKEIVIKVLTKHMNYTDLTEINLMFIILNLNYMRYVNNTNRFFKFYFENLPKYKNYLPFWEDQEKVTLRKITGDPLIESELLLHNMTRFDMMVEDVRKELQRVDPGVTLQMFTDSKIEDAINIVFSRAFRFTLKGWKIIHNLTEVDEHDLHNFGYILVPAADGINHESFETDHPDVEKSQIAYQRGKVVVKAGRKFKKGEEFFINYDAYSTVYDMFRYYGFVPIEALHKNMIFRNDYVDLSKAPREARLLCLALGACHGGTKESVAFMVPKFTNIFSMAHLNIERMNHWFGPPEFKESKIIEIYDLITKNKHSNLTEGIALSKFAHSFYGFLLYSSNFKTGINRLIEMYNLNEEGVPVIEIILRYQIKTFINNDHYDLRDRFREILKYSLINQHIVALNTREAIERLEVTLDNLTDELKKEIVHELS